MNDLLVSPSPATTLRRAAARLRDNPDTRSTAIGILGVLLVHLFLFFVGPRALRLDEAPSVLRPHSSTSEFNIEITPEMFEQTKQEEPPPTNFVEANPDAPDNVPDRTNNFAAQNQQVAQETPTPDGKSDRPTTEGRTDVQSTQIVDGSLTQQIEQLPTPPSIQGQDEQQEVQPAPRQEQIPLSGFEKTEGDNQHAYGSNIAKFAERPEAVPEHVEGAKEGSPTGASALPKIDPKNPRPRPQIVRQQQVRPAVFQENKFGTSNIGLAAWDAKWSNYGQYLQKLIDTVQIQWERILHESRLYPVNGTSVKVVFVLNSKGEIARIVNVEGTAGQQAEKACASAITSRAPYGPWTDDMLAVLGEEQELTFNFFYQ
mgnify:FL=1|jgi:hypothetical protein